MPKPRHQGFTLIEMSIVLVIIGLIVGGVLVGQNLIAAARLRKAVSQLQSYTIAANTFREKYSYLPGDMPNPQATNMGLVFRWAGAGQGGGDGNGILEGSNQSGGNNSNNTTGANSGQGGEFPLFWNDLSTAGMISDALTDPYVVGSCQLTWPFSFCIPKLNIEANDYVFVAEINGVNYFFLGNWMGSGWYQAAPMFTPNEMMYIDTKIDDGQPLTGRVQSVWVNYTAITLGSGPVGANQCSKTATSYNLSSTYANQPLCEMIVHMGIN